MNTHPYSEDEQKAAAAAGFTTPVPDWADALTSVRLGQRKLDDALPRSNAVDAKAGYLMLKKGVEDLHTFFALRGIDFDA
jgi:hypothetical protein